MGQDRVLNHQKPLCSDLESKLLQGLDSGEPIDITSTYWERKRSELISRWAAEPSLDIPEV